MINWYDNTSNFYFMGKIVPNAVWFLKPAEGAKYIVMHYSFSHAALSSEVGIEVNRIG